MRSAPRTWPLALGELDRLDVDRDRLYAAALLHDIGLSSPVPKIDFTWASARAARDLAEQVGLSATATDTLLTAVTLHHSPGVTLANGAVPYLLSAGAGLDVIGLRSWKLSPGVLAEVTSTYPRLSASLARTNYAVHGRDQSLDRATARS